MISEVEKIIGYIFKDKALLKLSFIHSSYNNNLFENNERLELLGDSVINCIITRYLFIKFKNKDVGELVKVKSFLIGSKVFHYLVLYLKLNNFLILNKNAENNKVRSGVKVSADLLEAILGAVFIDTNFNFNIVYIIFLKLFNKYISRILQQKDIYDYKSFLQIETMKKFSCLPIYKILEIDTYKQKKKVFEAQLFIQNKFYYKAIGLSKKEAENKVASLVCKKLKINIMNYYLKMVE